MSNISSIKLSGITYELKDNSATTVVELTQQQYDQLPSSAKTDNIIYVISDAQPVDIGDYWTSAQTQSAITNAVSGKLDTSTFETYSGSVETALSGKQDTLIAGDNITISGNVISASGGGGSNTVELTQAEYDALVSAGTVDQTTYYIISDATPIDMSNYWTSAQTQSAVTAEINAAVSGKVDSSSIVTAVTSASTDSEIPTAKAVFDVIPTGGTGGGKAISAGTNISVTTGETADTVSCTLPIVMKNSNMRINSTKEFANSLSNCFTFGGFNTVGNGNSCSYLVTFGSDNDMSASNNNRRYRYAFGNFLKTQNSCEIAFSKYNVSSSASETFGDSGNTLFSVGNGTDNNARHNAFEIRQNGDIYLSLNGQDVKLQDRLGGGSSYTAGDGIDITNGVISVTGKVDTSAITTSISSSSTDAQVPSAKAVYDTIGNINTILQSI